MNSEFLVKEQLIDFTRLATVPVSGRNYLLTTLADLRTYAMWYLTHFKGRGSTPLEAALRSQIPLRNDVNPLATALAEPGFNPPALHKIERSLGSIRFRNLEWLVRSM